MLMLGFHRHFYNLQTNIPQEIDEEQTSISCSLWICYSVFFFFVGACNSPNQPNAVKRKKLAVDSVFNKFDDEDSDDVPRKRKLVPLDYGEEDKSNIKGSVNTEEKRKHIKSLIEKIPTAKPELFAYPLDWSIVDSVSWFILIIHNKLLFFQTNHGIEWKNKAASSSNGINLEYYISCSYIILFLKYAYFYLVSPELLLQIV